MDLNDPRLTAYALNELDAADRAEVEAALVDSPSLREEVDAIRAAALDLESALNQEERLALLGDQRDAVLSSASDDATLAATRQGSAPRDFSVGDDTAALPDLEESAADIPAIARIEQMAGPPVRRSSLLGYAVAACLAGAAGIAIGQWSMPEIDQDSTENKRPPIEVATLVEEIGGGWQDGTPAKPELVELSIDLPKPIFVGTPVGEQPPHIKLQARPEDERETFMVPKGVTNIAKGKPATAIDDPFIGGLDQLTDGDKEATDGSYLILGFDLQWVQVDLEQPQEIYAILFWQFHADPRIFRDVIVQLADDEAFTKNVRTVFNNDRDNSARLGAGKDLDYFDSHAGKLVPVNAEVARYVRIYANGSTADDQNYFTEIEVHGIAPGGVEKRIEAQLAAVEKEVMEKAAADERERVVQNILRRVVELRKAKKYGETLVLLDQALFIDPNNVAAQAMKEMVEDTYIYVQFREKRREQSLERAQMTVANRIAQTLSNDLVMEQQSATARVVDKITIGYELQSDLPKPVFVGTPPNNQFSIATPNARVTDLGTDLGGPGQGRGAVAPESDGDLYGPAATPYSKMLTYPDDWPLVTKRRIEALESGGDESEANVTTRGRLMQPVPVNFEDAKLSTAVEYLRNTTGVNFFVNWPALEHAGISKDEPIELQLTNVPASQVLNLTIKAINAKAKKPLNWTIIDGIVTVSTQDDLINVKDEELGHYAKYPKVAELTVAIRELEQELENAETDKDNEERLTELEARLSTARANRLAVVRTIIAEEQKLYEEEEKRRQAEWQAARVALNNNIGRIEAGIVQVNEALLFAEGRDRADLEVQLRDLLDHRAEFHGHLAELEQRPFNTEDYANIMHNPFLAVNDNPLSTFSIDVDTASYANMRRFVNSGQLPPAGAVRIEEMINYFPYDYSDALPQGDEPFGTSIELADCPWNKSHRLMRVAIKGRDIEGERPASNLVFLIDVSGSMNDPRKLPLLKESFKLLIDELAETDRVALVVYAGSSGLVLDSTPGNEKQLLSTAIEALQPGGSTAGAAGIQLAYDIAAKNFIEDGTNRVILATDGDFNVGISSDDELIKLIEEKRTSGVFLSVLGFGTGNFKDNKMEQLANKGNGNYAYIDTKREAQKVLIEQMAGTLVTIAKDVKLQLEFNPRKVAGYRLIGYENRVLAAEDFNDDTKDAGEIGAGHEVTAMYELVLRNEPEVKDEVPALEGRVDPLKYQKPAALTDAADADELCTLKIRYKKPDEDVSAKLEFPVVDAARNAVDDQGNPIIVKSSESFRFASAVVGFGMILRDSPYKGDVTYDTVIDMARGAATNDKSGYRAEFVGLVEKAKQIAGE